MMTDVIKTLARSRLASHISEINAPAARAACRPGANPPYDHAGSVGPKVDVQYLRIYVRQLRQKLEEQPD